MIRLLTLKRFRGSSRILRNEILNIPEHKFREFYPKRNFPAFYALRARIGLDNVISVENLIDAAQITGKDREFKDGKNLIKRVVKEHLAAKYPNMPDDMLSVGISDICSTERMNEIGKRFGYQQTVLHDEKDYEPYVLSLVGMLEKELGEEKARKFIEVYFTHLDINWKKLIKIDRPDFKLNEITMKQYGVNHETRMLGESGRESPLPIYLVGVFAKNVKLAEGFGQSISMAQHNARVNALMDFYLKP